MIQAHCRHNRPISSCSLVGYVDFVEGDRLTVRVKNPFEPGDRLEWIGPGEAAGDLQIEAIWDTAGEPLRRAINSTVVSVAVKNAGQLPALDSIIRRRQP